MQALCENHCEVSLLEVVSFLLVFAGRTSRDLCHGSKLAVLSMSGGYSATKSSRDTLCCEGPLNNSGITINKSVGHSGLKSLSANTSWDMRFDELWTAVGSK